MYPGPHGEGGKVDAPIESPSLLRADLTQRLDEPGHEVRCTQDYAFGVVKQPYGLRLA